MYFDSDISFERAEEIRRAIEKLCAEKDDLADTRKVTLAVAMQLGADRAALRTLREATLVSRAATIVLPPNRLEGCSRGKGWCRGGKGKSAVWGERVDGGYRVGPGSWIVGGNDGFSRKKQDSWDVEHVRVGDATWTVAS